MEILIFIAAFIVFVGGFVLGRYMPSEAQIKAHVSAEVGVLRQDVAKLAGELRAKV